MGPLKRLEQQAGKGELLWGLFPTERKVLNSGARLLLSGVLDKGKGKGTHSAQVPNGTLGGTLESMGAWCLSKVNQDQKRK